ncbi:MAG: hypothetical protein AAGF53_14375 [Pseudomonadota bacterium]
MTDQTRSPQTPLGIYDKPHKERITAVEVVALLLTIIWMLGTAIFFLVVKPTGFTQDGGGALVFVVAMIAIFMPVAMIWVAAMAARSSQIMRQESHRLQSAIDSVRQAYIAQNQKANTVSQRSVAEKIDEIAAAHQRSESNMARFSSIRQEAKTVEPRRTDTVAEPGAQPDLPLAMTQQDSLPELLSHEFIQALNFPEDANDKAGFKALRKALKDPRASHLIQASQDVLTLLSQDGIYMDDLPPEIARPELWRRFAAGERGRVIAALGGIRDRASLALSHARMKQDTIFRDASHHFLRLFDRQISAFVENASDAEIQALSNTRTARAFMLLGRVAGTFN